MTRNTNNNPPIQNYFLFFIVIFNDRENSNNNLLNLFIIDYKLKYMIPFLTLAKQQSITSDMTNNFKTILVSKQTNVRYKNFYVTV